MQPAARIDHEVVNRGTRVEDLPLRRPTIEALLRLGAQTLADLTELTPDALACSDQVGESSLEQLQSWMSDCGLALKDTPSQGAGKSLSFTPIRVSANASISELAIWIGHGAVAVLRRHGLNTLDDVRQAALRGDLEGYIGLGSINVQRLKLMMLPTQVSASQVHTMESPDRRLIPTEAVEECAIRLTAREKDVMRWTMEGKTAWEVGRILGISERTAVLHINNAMHKLGCPTKYTAAFKAHHLGLI